MSYITLKPPTHTCVILCVASVSSGFSGLVFMCCVCGRKCALYIHYLMYSNWTRFLEYFYILYVKYLHTFSSRYCSDYYRCVYTVYIYIFLSCVKCCIEAVHFFFSMGQHIFLCYCKNKNAYFCIACDYHSVHTVSVFIRGRQ